MVDNKPTVMKSTLSVAGEGKFVLTKRGKLGRLGSGQTLGGKLLPRRATNLQSFEVPSWIEHFQKPAYFSNFKWAQTCVLLWFSDITLFTYSYICLQQNRFFGCA